MQTTLQALNQRAAHVLPRMLTQVCRDPNSPLHGSWDRNWWHYKIRDFSSIILQQGGYAMHQAVGLPNGIAPQTEFLHNLALSSAVFWNQRACSHGAFEEYYPYEQGYPPLAFSTLAMAKLVNEGVVPLNIIQKGLKYASEQLLSRFEPQAANQQIAGTAAVAMIYKVAPELVDKTRFDKLLDRSFDLQHQDGWFPEYDGPDLGYLTVTMDCLWDLHDATGDPRCLNAIIKSMEFVNWFIASPPHHAGMHNSRNTDYLVPYAIARLTTEDTPVRSSATRVLKQLYECAAEPDHFFAAIDDRYWCHYIGHSLFRAIHILQDASLPANSSTPQPVNEHLTTFQAHTGHVRLFSDSSTALVSAHKGGIVTATWENGAEANDYGWIIKRDTKQWVSHWWSTDWTVETSGQQLTICGPMVSHREHLSSPWKHMLLRVASFTLGRRLIGILKRLLIFKQGSTEITLERRIHFDQDTLVIRDQITGLKSIDQVLRAPRASKRHVASADSYHPQDASRLGGGASFSVESQSKDGLLTVETRYQPRSKY